MEPQQQPDAGNEQPFKELPVANLAPQHKKSKLPKFILLLGVLIVAVIVIFLLVDHHKAAAPATKATTKSTVSNTATTITSTTKRYDSTNLSLGFYYPSDWTISDTGSGKLTVTSPTLTLKSANSQTMQARIVMTIQPEQTTIPQFAANQAIAPLASQKLSYKQPTPNQRAQTYLTFVNYTGVNTTVDTLYITGDNGYTAGQYVPQSDIVKDDPLVSIGFYACADAACTNYTKTTGIATSSWADTNLSKPLIDMLQSLTID